MPQDNKLSDTEILSQLQRARWELEVALNALRAEMADDPTRPMVQCRHYQDVAARRERLSRLRDHWNV